MSVAEGRKRRGDGEKEDEVEADAPMQSKKRDLGIKYPLTGGDRTKYNIRSQFYSAE